MQKQQTINYSLLAKDFSIFIDTCSLMRPQAQDFLMQEIVPYLKLENKKIMLIKEVKDELEKIQDDENNQQPPEKRLEAKNAYKTCIKLDQEGCLDYRGKLNSINYADNYFITKFAENRYKKKLCLITQDRKLSYDILSLNESASSGKAKGIKVYSLNKKEGLKEFFLKEEKNITPPPLVKKSKAKKDSKVKPLFSDKAKLIDVKKRASLNITNIPTTNDEVQNESGKTFYLIGGQIGSGAEGIVYSIRNMNSRNTSSKTVCKIYEENKLDNQHLDKLKKMVDNQINSHGICWPKSILYNNDNEPVGFIMKSAGNAHILDERLFTHPKIFEEELPGWDRANLVKVCLNILSAVNLLHKHNVILGDISGSNIMVTDQCETFIVDADSFQIEGYPCPMRTGEFVAPEIQNKNLGTILRTKENEYFSLAILLFMILMCGKHPYDSVDGGMVHENIKNSKFPYPFGSMNSVTRDGFVPENAPPGIWRPMWSHLTHACKEDFYNCFEKNERIDGVLWKKTLNKYHKYLEMGAEDLQSYAIIPDTYKVVSPETSDRYNNNQ